MSLQEYREKIDGIDRELTELFEKRMRVSSEIAAYKAENNLPVYDPARERQKLTEILSASDPALSLYTGTLYSLLFELSRAYQRKQMKSGSALQSAIRSAAGSTAPLFPARARVAVQGVEGAFSQQAAEKIFSTPDLLFFSDWEGVFSAVRQGLCRYGVLPIENSTAGSVNRIYDLMMKNDFYIVRSVRVKVDHCLLANPGVQLADIKEIITHEQAIAQCADFLKSLGNVRATPCANTAGAAKMLRESGRRDAAVLSSRACAELYGLTCLRESVQDRNGNFTRFICISKNMEIYPGADRTSVMMVLPHKPGSLYRALSRFNALGVNLLKLESRPLPDSDFEFMFYFDLGISVYSDEFLQIFSDLTDACTSFKYLGSYSEAV